MPAADPGVVAAILAAGAIGAGGNRAPKAVVENYRAILEELRGTGGALPKAEPRK